MSTILLRPQGQLSPAEALKVAQQAPDLLRSNPRAFSTSPLSTLLSAPESSELWTIYENLLLSCLRTGDDRSAQECLDRIVIRFGAKDERVMALQGLVDEAKAPNNDELQRILKVYETLLHENDSNVPIAKRRVALLRSMGKISEAIAALNSLLNFASTDSEAWAELADLYLGEGLYAQAIFAFEEVLVLVPNAWNVHARLGEVLLMAATANPDNQSQKQLAESLKRFARSIELCDDYLRGYYGLKLVTDKILDTTNKTKRPLEKDEFALPDQVTVQRLSELATKKLTEIVRHYTAGERLWQGYSSGEIAAARDLIAQSTSEIVR